MKLFGLPVGVLQGLVIHRGHFCMHSTVREGSRGLEDTTCAPLASGCNIGNTFTGLSVLALNSVIATKAIVSGAAVAVAWPGIRRLVPGLHMSREQR